MRRTALLFLPLAMLALASPAHATGGLLCRTAGARPIEVSLVISHTVVPAVISARLVERGREVPVAVAQSWLEAGEVRVDLTDRNAQRHEARLRVRAAGRAFDGTLWREGRRQWVRCREG